MAKPYYVFIDLSKLSVSVWSVLKCKRLYSIALKKKKKNQKSNGQYLWLFFFSSRWKKNPQSSIVRARQRAHARVMHSSGVSRKLVTQEPTWRDERLSRHALTTAFSGMPHAELIHHHHPAPRGAFFAHRVARSAGCSAFPCEDEDGPLLTLQFCFCLFSAARDAFAFRRLSRVFVFKKFNFLWTCRERGFCLFVFFFSDTLENRSRE